MCGGCRGRRALATWSVGLICGLVATNAPAVMPTLRTDSEYLIDSWDTEDGLPENSATAVVQDRAGYLWFGTFRGLVRFDGVEFTRCDPSNTPQLPGEGIVNLHLDRAGRLWVSTLRGLAVRDASGWRALTPANADAAEVVRTFSERSNGDLLLTTFNGLLLECAGGKLRPLALPPGPAGRGYFGHADELGRWWAVRSDFIGFWNGDTWVAAANLGGGADACATARDGGMWLLRGSTLVKCRGGAEVQRFDLSQTPRGVWGLSEDAGGGVWITTIDGGLLRVSRGGEQRRWNTASGLAYDGTRCAFEDAERNIWVGTTGGGLQRFKPRRFTQIGTANGLAERNVRSVSAGDDGALWIGTYGRGLFRLHEGKVDNVALPGWDGRAVYVQSVLEDRAGRLWVGTFGQGLWLREQGRFRRVPVAQTGGANVIRLFEDSKGCVWINGGEGVAVYYGAAFHSYGAPQGAPTGAVWFAEDGEGTLWLASRDGVYRFTGGRFHEVTNGGRPIREVTSLAGDSAGVIWISARRAPLLCYRAGALKCAAAAPAAGDVSAVLDDATGFLWLASDRGVTRVSRDEILASAGQPDRRLTHQTFDLEDGLPSIEFPQDTQPKCARDKSGRLWFATSKGVATIDPASLRLNLVPPPVHVQALTYRVPIRRDGTGRPGLDATRQVECAPPFNRQLLLPAGSRRIEIHYAAMNLAAPSKVRYQVSLGDADGDWQDVGNQRVAQYYDLRPGRYVFRVRAKNNDGAWNETGARVDFAVGPYFWQTPWFAAGVGLALVGGGACGAWQLSHSRHRRAREKHERRERQSAALLKLSAGTAGDLAQGLREIAETTAPVLDVGRVCVSLIDDARAEQRCVETFSRPPDTAEAPETFDLAGTPAYFTALREGRVIAAADASNDPRTSELADRLASHGVRSVLEAPVRAHGRLVGAVRFEHRGKPRAWREDEVRFAAAVADRVAHAMLNSERERAHRELRESEERFRLLADAAPVMIWRSGVDGLCDFFNKQWLDFTGHPMEREVGNGWARGVHPDDVDHCLNTYKRAFEARAPFQVEFRLRRADTDFRWVLGTGVPRFDAGGGFAGYIGSCVDVTERKRAEVEAQQQRLELAHLSRVTMLGELSGSLAHELNQPLTAILSNAQAAQRFAARDDVDLAELREILKDIVEEDKRAGEVIRRLRLLLKKGEVNCQPLDMNELVLDVLRLLRSDLVQHNVTVEAQLSADLPPVMGDRVQLQQVLMNLVMNACDAFNGEAERDRSISVRTCQLGGSRVRTTVSDQGVGIPPHLMERIFDPFFTTKSHGMGLGLAVCRTIVDAHGGDLSAENNPAGRGASFHVTLQPDGVAS